LTERVIIRLSPLLATDLQISSLEDPGLLPGSTNPFRFNFCSIFSEEGVQLHRKENILRSPVKDLNIQIPFPKNISGDLKIRITVVDLVENYKTVEDLLVTL